MPCSPAGTARQSAASTPSTRTRKRLAKCHLGCGTVKDSVADPDPSDPCLVHQQAQIVNLLLALRLGEQEKALESVIRNRDRGLVKGTGSPDGYGFC